MSLKQIVQSKDKHFQSMLTKFDTEYEKLSRDAQKLILAYFRNGDYTAESIASAMAEHESLIQEWAIRNQESIKYSKLMAAEMGVKFAVTEETIRNFDLISDIGIGKLRGNIDSYIADMRKFGLEYNLEGKSFSEIAAGLAEKFEELGRKLNTEINTGIRMADAVIKKDFFEQAGVEKYVYFGPDDNKTRLECTATLSDPLQDTGWTMEEINSSATPYIDRGGYNCRHEWLPFVEGM